MEKPCINLYLPALVIMTFSHIIVVVAVLLYHALPCSRKMFGHRWKLSDSKFPQILQASKYLHGLDNFDSISNC